MLTGCILALLGTALGPGRAARAGEPDADAASPPRDGLTVLFLGDSLAQGLYLAMVRALRGHDGLRLVNAAKHGTGLTRVDQFDWVGGAREAIRKNSPDLVLFWIGANDFRPLVDREKHLRADFGTPDFLQGYGARVEAIAALGAGNGEAGPVLAWIGLPNMRDARFAEAAGQLNDLQMLGVRAHNALWVPSWDLTSDAAGQFLVSVVTQDRSEQRLRADDGVHFSDVGYRMVARRALGAVATARPALAARLGPAIGDIET